MTALCSFVDIYATLGTVQWSDVADPRVAPEYVTKLAAPVSFEKSLPTVGAGVMPERYADVAISNVNTAISTVGVLYGIYENGVEMGYGEDGVGYGGTGEVTLSELLAVEDVRGRRARARVFDLDTSALLFTVDGVVTSPKAGGAQASLRIETRHQQAFNQLIPLQRIIDVYPLADLTGAADQDAPVIKPFGIMRKVRLVAVKEVSGAYDYGLFYKPLTGTLTLNTVYREDRVVPASEYSWVEAMPGYYVVRFAREQRDNGRPWEIRATVSSTEFDRPSDAVAWVLVQCGLRVNAPSFATAATDYIATGYGRPAHGLHERRRAGDVLNDLLLHGAALELNSALEYVINVDTLADHPAASMSIGAGDNQFQNADPETVEWETINDTDQVGTLKLAGIFDVGFRGESIYLATATHTIPGGTVTLEETCAYLGDVTALDAEACYRAKRLRYSAQALTLEADLETRDLALGTLVPVYIPNDIINGNSYELSRQAYSASRSGEGEDVDAHFALTLRKFNPDIFTYTAGTVQVPAAGLSLTDYTYTIPDAPTALALVSATVQGTSGLTIVVHSATAPPANVTDLVFRAVPTGSVIPLAGEAMVPCVPSQAGIQGTLTLTAGLSYTIQCFARNRGNAPGFQDGLIAQILNYVPAGDTSVPPQVTGLAVTAGSYKTLNISWSGIADYTRLDNYEVFVSLNSAFTSLVKILTPRSADVTVSSLANGTTYWVRVRAVYKNRLPGAFSNTVSAITALVATPDVGSDQILYHHIAANQIGGIHIGANQIGTAHIQANSIDNVKVQANAIDEVNITADSISTIKIQGDAVTAGKRQPVATLTAAYSLGSAPSGTQFNFTHAIGRIPLVTVDTSNSAVTSHIFTLSATEIFVALENNLPLIGASGTVKVYFW